MKLPFLYLILGSLVLTIILQGVLFASYGIQASREQKQLDELSQKFDRLQMYTDTTQKMIIKINSFIDEPLPKDQETSATSDPNDLLSEENLNKTLGK